jgi:hypothetical protein
MSREDIIKFQMQRENCPFISEEQALDHFVVTHWATKIEEIK